MNSAAKLAAVVLALTAAAPAQAASPVLGKLGLMGKYGKGFGKAKPSVVFNGGSPGGLADKIRWRNWGGKTATGRGVIAAYRPEGGYYAKRVPIQLRATRLGRCPGGKRRAYTRLVARSHDRPGGRYGDWFPWTLDLCDFDAEPDRCGSVAYEPNTDWGASDVTAWDTSCDTARAVAAAAKTRPLRPGDMKQRFVTDGFACNGYSLEGEGLPSTTWTCTRGTAVVGFKQS